MARWEVASSERRSACVVAGRASLGVLHAGSAGHLPELRKHAESTYRQHAAVAATLSRRAPDGRKELREAGERGFASKFESARWYGVSR